MEFNDGSQYRVLVNADAQVAAGREMFAYRVASRRNGWVYVDTAFSHHRAITAGFKATLLYQFTYADQIPEDAADFFCQALGWGLQQQEMICLDLETGGGFTPANVGAWAKRWLDFTESRLQTKAWLYVPGTLSSAVSASVAADRIIWAPRYSGTATRGTAPSWRHDVHQYTDQGFFPGCATSGDTSYTTLTTDEMLRRCNPTGIASGCGV